MPNGGAAAGCKRSNLIYCATMPSIISISNLSKTYASGFQALRNVNLEIRRGEIFALLGPNGAGKTTLIGAVCGLVSPSSGRITVDGHDIRSGYRETRALIGLVPQELTTDAFESVWHSVSFSRGLFGGRSVNEGRHISCQRTLSQTLLGSGTMLVHERVNFFDAAQREL